MIRLESDIADFVGEVEGLWPEMNNGRYNEGAA